MTWLRRTWPLWTAVVSLAAALIWVWVRSRSLNGGRFVYDLDDVYIHMAVAKNIVQNGVWGVTPHAFSSSTSSPLWPLLLAAAYLPFGPNELTPLMFNLAASVFLLYVSWRVLTRHGVPAAYTAATLLGVAFLTPIPAVAFGGMEHILQAAVTIALVFTAADVLAVERVERPVVGRLLALCALATAVRYEGFLAVGVVGFLLAVQRRWRMAGGCIAAGGVPIVAYGIASVLQGARFLPYSILLKTQPLRFGSPQSFYEIFLHTPILKLQWALHVLVLLVVAIVFLAIPRVKGGSPWDRRALPLLIFAITAWLHMVVAGIGWFYRYEAYLVALGIVSLVVALAPYLPTRIPTMRLRHVPRYVAILLALTVVLVPLTHRGVESLYRTPQATNNIYDLPYQLGLFFNAYYAHEAVAVNDAGAVNFLSSVRCLDLWGLSSHDVGESRLAGTFNAERIRELALSHGVQVAVVYDSWFSVFGGMPADWIRVGQWRLQHNVVAGDDTYSFYGLDLDGADRLRGHLREFAPSLPPELIQLGYLE